MRDLPIEQVIDRYVTLKQAGANYKACCPLPDHAENTPSFYVVPAKNFFKCHGCGAGGDAIKFVMLHQSVSYPEAVKRIASDHGIAIEETEGTGKTPEQISEEQQMHDWLLRAEEKYRKALKEHPAVIRYLYNRDFKRSTLIAWQFGVVGDWKVMAADLMAAGKFDIGEKAGLVKKGNGNQWDVMHHRITIPIHTPGGEVIGFVGRTCDALKPVKGDIEGPKYMNPPETPLYEKSKQLFGLHQAISAKAFAKHGMAVLVEGNLDVVKLHQCGWNNTVGTGGTALTVEQAKLLKRFNRTDTVLILRDGDKAGRNAIKKDIPILLEQQFTVYVCELPEGVDPDDLFTCNGHQLPGDFIAHVISVLSKWKAGIEYMADMAFTSAGENAAERAKAIEQTAELLSLISNMVVRDQFIKNICKNWKVKPGDLTRPVAGIIQRRADAAEEERLAKLPDDPNHGLPVWVDRKALEGNGFVQLRTNTDDFKAGIYFQDATYRNLYAVTNFTMDPLFHIFEQYNNRRLIEIQGEGGNSVVELPTNCLSTQSQFEVELMGKGNFFCNERFGKKEFKRVTGWMLRSMPIAYELKTLGWQPEGFFAYSNAVHYNGNLIPYDELGMIKVDEKHYMSMGNSKLRKGERETDNPYENDLYLKFVKPREGMTFDTWAGMFNNAYGEHAPYGIAFVLLTLFKDMVTKVSKMPLLYCYGQKGSGKSAMAESISWLFFSGKNSEGNLIQGFNLNPGQSTQFSFYNRLERFRNCPILMNEYDENVIEPWKIGGMKASYDGEGREVGVGESGKRKVTRIQKVQGTIIIVGQYFGLRDDGAVASRSIPCAFSLERVKQLTPEQIKTFNLLRKEEQDGLCFLLTDLLKLRPEVQKNLALNFAEIQSKVMERMRINGYRIEARLISSYSIMLACTKTVVDAGLQLPYTYQSFYDHALIRMINHNQLLKDNSIVGMFWKSVEVMFDKGIIASNIHMAIEHFPNGIPIKDGASVKNIEVGQHEILLLRFDNVYDEYAKYQRERGNSVQNSKTVLGYLQEQTYYLGLHPVHSFNDKRTSAYAFNYTAMKDMGLVLEKITQQNTSTAGNEVTRKPAIEPELFGKKDDQPF